MKKTHIALLWGIMLLLAAHSIYVSRKLSLMVDEAHIERLHVKHLELVQPSGRVVGSITAGNDGDAPRIKLKQEDKGHYCTLGFAGDDTGPVLELISEFGIGKWSESIVKLGAANYYQHGLWIRGRKSDDRPVFTGWQIHRDETNSGEYVHHLPGTITGQDVRTTDSTLSTEGAPSVGM